MQRVAGANKVVLVPPQTGAEDFSFYAEKVPGLFVFLGGRPANVTKQQAPPHHTPDFFVDEAALELGVRTMTSLALEYLRMHPQR